MARRFDAGVCQFELVDGWPQVEIQGVAATVGGDSQGNLYVGVRNIPPGGGVGNILGGQGHVLVLNPDGSHRATWEYGFSSPHNIWINAEDQVFVADTGLHTITRHDASGRVLQTIGTPGVAGGPGAPFNMPTSAMEAPNGDIFVSDGYGQNWVHRFTARGEHVTSWGGGAPVFLQKFRNDPVIDEPSTEPGQFNLPHHVYVDADSRVLVLDRENNRWQVFTPDGQFTSMVNGVSRPNDIAVDANGNFHLVGDGHAEVFSPSGEKLGRWGTATATETSPFVNGPHGCWMDTEGSFYVAEVGGNNRLQKFRRG